MRPFVAGAALVAIATSLTAACRLDLDEKLIRTADSDSASAGASGTGGAGCSDGADCPSAADSASD